VISKPLHYDSHLAVPSVASVKRATGGCRWTVNSEIRAALASKRTPRF